MHAVTMWNGNGMVAIIFGYGQLETGGRWLVEMALQKEAWDNIILRQCWYMYREEKVLFVPIDR